MISHLSQLISHVSELLSQVREMTAEFEITKLAMFSKPDPRAEMPRQAGATERGN